MPLQTVIPRLSKPDFFVPASKLVLQGGAHEPDPVSPVPMASRLCMKQHNKGTHCFKALGICVLLGYDLKFTSYSEVQDTVRKLLPTSTLRGTAGV